MTPLRIGTRGSQLALWQANYILDRLRPVLDPRPIEIVIIETYGDVVLDRPLASLGGFGVFTKAIQESLLDSRVDVAVHSPGTCRRFRCQASGRCGGAAARADRRCLCLAQALTV